MHNPIDSYTCDTGIFETGFESMHSVTPSSRRIDCYCWLKSTDTRKIKTAKAMEAPVHPTIFAAPLELELAVAPLDEEINVAALERIDAVALKCTLAFAGLFADTVTVVVWHLFGGHASVAVRGGRGHDELRHLGEDR